MASGSAYPSQALDPRLSQWAIEDLAGTETGQQIRSLLQILFPNLVMEDGIEVVRRAAALGAPLTALNLLRQLPQETMEIDGLALVRMAIHLYLARHLASHGLTVVAVEHPGSNGNALLNRLAPPGSEPRSIILPPQEFLDRPRDISFVLDRLEIVNRYSYSLRHRLNTQQVTLGGHSLGGYTGLALAGAPLDLGWLEQRCRHGDPLALTPTDWLQCTALDLPTRHANLQDQRITQLILLNPLTGLLFGQSGLSQVRVPTLLLASSQDTITPIWAGSWSTLTSIVDPGLL